MKESILKNYDLLDDQAMDNTIRPETMEEYIGQTDVKENIKIFVEAAKMRNEALDHVPYMALLVLEKPLVPLLLQEN